MTGRAVPHRPPGPLSLLGLTVIVAVIVIDQIAKYVAEAALPFGQAIDLLPILSLLRTHNPGIAFSLLDGFGTLPLVAIVLAVTVTVLWIWVRANEGGRLSAVGYALIIGGAVGNLIDRLRLGYVVDYLYLHVDLPSGRVALFIFNLADAALTLGPGLLILALLLRRYPADAA